MRRVIHPGSVRRSSVLTVIIFATNLIVVATSNIALAVCPPNNSLYVSEYKAKDVQYYSPPGSLTEHPFVGMGVITGPTGMAYDSTSSTLYLSNTTKPSTNYILAIDSCGNISKFSSDPLLGYPHGLRFDSSGNLFVATAGAMPNGMSVVEFLAGSSTPTVYANNSDAGVSFLAPVDVAVDHAGHVWVSDTKADLVYEFSSAHNLLRTISSTGAFGLAISNSGTTLFVSNQKANSLSVPPPAFYVEKYDVVTGADLGPFIDDSNRAVAIRNPLGILFDSMGNLFVANSAYDEIEVFSSSGVYKKSVATMPGGTPHFLLIH
ncbi:MAG TPA: hypothetical protein VGI60_02690 [Chthoniobacterales bacterium]|jgi:sugar lactone lactonase YvrE